MPEPKRILKSRYFFWVVIAVLLVYFALSNITTVGNLFKVMIGFGFMIMIHEFGHFIVAKLSNIKVEAFSIGFPPTLAAIRRTEKGYCIKILPRTRNQDQSDTAMMSFTLGRKAKAGETEYRIGLIPLGGFVKMLGQEDIGPVKTTDDPRSFANKPVGIRFSVVAAGVFFNIISAIILFMITFMVGVDFPAPVVGGVVDGSPAAKAGLQAGDEIIEIDGRSKGLDFRDIAFAAVLSDWAEEIPFKVRRKDGSVEQVYMAAEKMAGDSEKKFGIEWPLSLEITEVTYPNALKKATSLQPGDRIISVNGKDVEHFWELEEIINDSYAPAVSMLAERRETGNEAVTLVETEIPLAWPVDTGSGLSNVCSMVPRLRVYAVSQLKQRPTDWALFKLKTLLAKAGIGQAPAKYELKLKPNDIIIKTGETDFPTYYELADVTEDHEGKELPIIVLRYNDLGEEELVEIIVRPVRQGKSVLIGFTPLLDVEHPVVAKTIEIDSETGKLQIPPGATITAIDGKEVPDFLTLARYIAQSSENKIIIKYISADGKKGSAELGATNKQELVKMKPIFAVRVPFDSMNITHKADGPVEAVIMGFNKTVQMIAMTYASFKIILTGEVGGESIKGPIGILQLSYEVASTQPLIYYVYLMAFLSSLIAVFNFLPVPPLDGGWALFLVIEKIKGSAVNQKIQTAITGVGLFLIVALAIYVTFNDIAGMIGALF